MGNKPSVVPYFEKAKVDKKRHQLPVDPLEPLDLSKEISLLGPMMPSTKSTKFMEEIGSQLCKMHIGSEGTNKNQITKEIIEPIIPLLSDYSKWNTTSTLVKDTWAMVKEKVDRAPVEEHHHYGRLWEAYKAIADYLLEKNNEGLLPRDDQKLMTNVRSKGSVGWREPDLDYSTLKEYLKHPKVWKPRVQEFKRCLMYDKPKWCTFNAIGKKEKKKNKKSSRLIWFLPATARIYENQVFGNLDFLLRRLPYSIQPLSITDYGVELSKIFKKHKRAICDDVSGWDTRISLGLLSLESAFLERLTLKRENKKEVRQLYRLYSYPLMMLTRPKPSSGYAEPRHQNYFFRFKGQRASGVRVTYAMNTITNIAITMSRAGYSQSIEENKMYDWTLNNLRSGHTNSYGGKICGDDSVIILGKEEAEKYVTLGVKFMTEIGMPRKDQGSRENSPIYERLEDIEFCSRSFVKIKFKSGLYRWMPVRRIDDILAKAVITKYRGTTTVGELSFAREQGLNLIVNYFHIPTVRLVAMAILSATPSNTFMNFGEWTHRKKPWIRRENVIDIINDCLFGKSTVFKRDYRIKTLEDLGTLDGEFRDKYDIKDPAVLTKWITSLHDTVEKLRAKYANNGYTYDNWLPNNSFDPVQSFLKHRHIKTSLEQSESDMLTYH